MWLVMPSTEIYDNVASRRMVTVKKKPGSVSRAPRVLVIYKKSAYQIYVRERKNSRIQRLIRTGDETIAHLLRAHHDHVTTVQEARKVFERLGAKAVFRYRSDLRDAEDADLVVSLGGDGTLLWASHVVGAECPLLAINTAPSDSIGYFCAGTKHDLESVLADALNGRLKETRLARMRVEVDGKIVSARVLNDALYTHRDPAATSRYIVRFRDKQEEHKSSGVWVGPAAGSTAAIYSAGGKVLAVTSKRLQFVVREPFCWGKAELKIQRGLVRPDEDLRIRSKNRLSSVYIDGSHLRQDVGIGSEIRFCLSNEPLTLLGFRRRR
jgi:NAD+ kinase